MFDRLVMLKKELRLNFTSQRRQFSTEEVSASSRSIEQLVRQLPIWDYHSFHIFLSIKKNKEIDTVPIINYMRGLNKQILVPRINSEQLLDAILLLDDTRLEENRWGIPEPSEGTSIDPKSIDVVFVPLLVFDQKGHRVGYGKGYYDKFLQSCKTDVVKIGLSYFEAVDEISDINPNDIAMDYCVTPKKIYSF